MEETLITKKMKVGWKSTEFWGSIAAGAAGLAMTLGYIGQDEVNTIVNGVTELAGAFITAASVFGYTMSRGVAKAKAEPAFVEAEAKIAATKMMIDAESKE